MFVWDRVKRRGFCGAAASALLLAGAAAPAGHAARADELPRGNITLIVPFGAGGSADSITRVVAQKLSEQIKRPIIVQNKPGASSIIGTEAIVQAKPDGSVIGSATTTTVSIVPAIYADLPFNTATDIKPIALFAVGPDVFVVNNNVKAHTIPEFVAETKANKGEFHYGSAGVGHTYHLLAELLKSETGAEMSHVPYKRDPDILQDLIAGRIQASFSGLIAAMPFIKSGMVRPLALAAEHRSPDLPDVPTFSELGIHSMDQPSWYGFIGPARLPDAIAEQLAEGTKAALQTPEVKAAFARFATYPTFLGPADFKTFIAEELAKWSKIAKAQNIRVQ